MGIPNVIILALLLVALSGAKAASYLEECIYSSNCDGGTGLKCYTYSHCSIGRCTCGPNAVWLSKSCGHPVGALGHTCKHDSQCSFVVPNSECSNDICVCSNGYYKSGTYLCLEGPGTVAINNVCTNSPCLQGLICTRCPSVLTGDARCRNQSGTVSLKAGAELIFLLAILSSTVLLRLSL